MCKNKIGMLFDCTVYVCVFSQCHRRLVCTATVFYWPFQQEIVYGIYNCNFNMKSLFIGVPCNENLQSPLCFLVIVLSEQYNLFCHGLGFGVIMGKGVSFRVFFKNLVIWWRVPVVVCTAEANFVQQTGHYTLDISNSQIEMKFIVTALKLWFPIWMYFCPD